MSAVDLHVPGHTSEQLEKLARLLDLLRSFGRVVVAYSGGVDSAFLLRVAHEALGGRATALTARSPSLMAVELEDAVALAREIGVRHEIVETRELDRPGYVENSVLRCYHCKTELFDVAADLASRAEPGVVVVDGVNLDDLGDHRPGLTAAAEHGVRHPLAEVGLRKQDVRALSRHLGLRTWSKPQLACLSSRIPYGTSVTPERLSRIERVEVTLRRLGFHDVRARLVAGNDDMVRIEVGAGELLRVVADGVREAVIEAAHGAGFRFVTLDLDGFKSGRMNEGRTDLVRIGAPKPEQA